MRTTTPKSYTLFYCLLLTINTVFCSVAIAENNEFVISIGEENFTYSTVQAGENYNFKFNKNITNENTRLTAGYHVLNAIYKDDSINKTYSEGYIRERARCYVFDSSLHTYTLCFLPNEFSKKDNDRLWGFVTQMPNWKWLLTRFFLPVLLAFSLFFYMMRPKGDGKK